MGGAAGHMRHPFDLSNVKSGEDLIHLFERLPYYIQSQNQNVSLKVDGLNMSIRRKTDGMGNFYGYCLDRGSQKRIDIEGVTVDRLVERFGEGHGMVSAGKKILDIFNGAHELIKADIGCLLPDKYSFLNIEFIEGKTNSIDYGRNMIVIHEVREFYSVVKKNCIIRNGLINYTENKRAKSVSSSRNNYHKVKKAMENLIINLNRYFVNNDINFKAYHKIDVEYKFVDYSKVLNEPLTLNFKKKGTLPLSIEHLNGSSLLLWLKWIKTKPAQYVNTDYDHKFKRSDKKINPYHKATYLKILEGEETADEGVYLYDLEDQLSGFVLLHATKVLGAELLKGIETEVGNASNHEGIVIKNMFSETFKITGDFIVNGMFGRIKEIVEREKNELNK